MSFQMRKNEAQEKVWMHQKGSLIESTALDNNWPWSINCDRTLTRIIKHDDYLVEVVWIFS